MPAAVHSQRPVDYVSHHQQNHAVLKDTGHTGGISKRLLAASQRNLMVFTHNVHGTAALSDAIRVDDVHDPAQDARV